MTEDEKLDAIDALSAKLYAVLKGQHPDVIGPCLADVVAMWVAGHVGRTPAATETCQGALLELHNASVRGMLPDWRSVGG